MGLHQKKIKWLMMSLFFIVLALLPWGMTIYHTKIYFVFCGIGFGLSSYSILFEKRKEEAFFRRWKRMRSYPKWQVMMISFFKETLWLILIVLLGQYFGNNRSLFSILRVLEVNQILVVVMLLVFFGAITGYAKTISEEKRFSKLAFKKMRESKETEDRLENNGE